MSRILRFRVWDTTESRWGSFEAFIGEGYTDLNDKRNDVIITQFTGLLDSKGREIWEGDILCWVSSGVPIPHSQHDNRKPQSTRNVGTVTWGVVHDDEYGNDVVGWTLEGHRVYSQEGRADIRHSFEGDSLYAVVNQHAKDYAYPDSSWYVSLTACEVIGNIFEHGHLLK